MNMHRMTVALAMAIAATAAHSQQTPPPAPPKVEKIEVTGSNIKRIEGESALPVQVITREDIQRSGAVTVEQLMQTISATSSYANTVSANSAGASTSGISTVSLRGLVSTRTLVLINGRRIAAYGSITDSVSVDVNSIPLAAIERVEVLKDGASAIYGSDAVAGVINFILRKDFRGAEVTAEAGGTSQGGAAVRRATVALGTGDLARDRYNAMLVASYQKEEPLYGRDREFARRSIFEDLLNDGSSGNTFPGNIFFLDDSGRTRNPGAVQNCPGPYATLSPFFPPNRCRFDPSPLVSLVLGSEKSNLSFNGVMQLGSGFELYAEASYSKNEQRTIIQPVPISDQFALPATNPLANQFPYNAFTAGPASTILLRPTSAFYPAAYVRSIIGASTALPDLLVRYRAVESGDRDITNIATQPRFVIGARATLGKWDVDANFLTNSSKMKEIVNDGYPQLSRILPILNSGRVNFFGPNSPEVTAEIRGTNFNGLAFVNETGVDTLSARATREIMPLAGGPLSVALGLDTRKERYESVASTAIQTGDISGYGGNFLNIDRSREVMAAYGEVSAPLLKNLELGAALRYDDYDAIGKRSTPKYSLRWQPDKSVLIRASYGKGFRAPSLTDLFAAQTEGVTAAGVSDPLRCPQTQDGNDCLTQFRTINGGNPNLRPENSRSMTAGIVLEPFTNVSLALDLFRVDLEQTIIYGLSEFTILGDLNRFGSLVTRGPRQTAFPNLPGPITAILSTNLNLGRTRMQGVDVDARYRMSLGQWGGLTAQLNGTYFQRHETENIDGGFDTNMGAASVNGAPVARWRHYLSLEWTKGSWAASVAQTWQTGYRDLCGNLDGDCLEGLIPPRRVGAYENYDLQASYSGVKNLKVVVGVKNVFDRDPPLSLAGGQVYFQGGFDPTYTDPRGRFGYVRATYSFR